MFQNRAAVAWVVLLIGFFTFCILAFGIPLSAKKYLSELLEAESAQLEVIRGSALVQKRGTASASAIIDATTVGEGDRIVTTGNSRAIVWLPGGSNLQLWPETAISIPELRSSRFNTNNSVIKLRQDSGHSRVEVAMLVSKNRTFEMATAHGIATLREGSYSVSVEPQQSEVIAHQGSATVEGGKRSIELLRAERATIRGGEGPSNPMPRARNLVANGDFAEGLDGWQWGNRDEEEAVLGSASLQTVDGLPAVRLLREGATKHAETYIVQPVNRDVTDFESLKLGLDLKLVKQSLSGGGWLGSEYPLMIKVKYRDVWGSEAVFRRGFFYQNKDGHPTTNGEKVDHDVWIKKDGYDLFNRSVSDLRPAQVISIELAASGWSYESLTTNIRLIAE